MQRMLDAVIIMIVVAMYYIDRAVKNIKRINWRNK
jgi:hypothetical protein